MNVNQMNRPKGISEQTWNKLSEELGNKFGGIKLVVPTNLSFEFGVSLGDVEFIENEMNGTIEDCDYVMDYVMGKIDSEDKVFGMVVVDGTKVHVSTRPYVDDWEWDFDHEDTTEIEFELP